MLGYKTGAAMAADLKIAAHRVRQAVDAKPMTRDENGHPVNQRRKRLCQITAEAGTSHQLPDIEPAARHALSVDRPLPSGGAWYARALRDRNSNGLRRRTKAA